MENSQQSNINDITISQKAEQSVLGSILLNNDAIIDVVGIIKPEDFSYDAHKIIYFAMVSLFKDDSPIDLLTISEKIRNISNLEEVGGYSYIATLPSATDYTKNVSQYAKIVKEKSKLRQIISSSNNIIHEAYSGKGVNEVLEIAEKTIFDISQDTNKSTLLPIQEVLMSTYNVIEENYKNKGKMTGIDTGFTDLNHITNGLQKTDLIIVGARPATGKTAFALNIAQNSAKKGAKVAIFSLEMSDTQLMQRVLAAESKVPLEKIKNGSLEVSDWQNLAESISIMEKFPLHINDTAGINLLEIRSQCRKQKMKSGLDLVIIDYLQLMETEGSSESRQLFISQISRGLKIMAKELNCVVIALSQLSRESEKRANHRPMLSDLRESGSIEQDADMVMFLHREELLNPDTDKKNITEVIIAKHRSGEVGSIELAWRGQFQLFLNLEKY